MPLQRETNLQDGDAIYAAIIAAHADLSEAEAIDTARQIWREINLPNLRENIRPTRERAHLILEKGEDHSIENVRLRRV